MESANRDLCAMFAKRDLFTILVLQTAARLLLVWKDGRFDLGVCKNVG